MATKNDTPASKPAPFAPSDDVAHAHSNADEVLMRPALLINPEADADTVLAAARARTDRLHSMALLLSTMRDTEGEFSPVVFASSLEPQLDEIRQLLERVADLINPHRVDSKS